MNDDSGPPIVVKATATGRPPARKPLLSTDPRSGRAGRWTSVAYAVVRWLGAGLFLSTVLGVVLMLAWQSATAFTHDGIGFLWSGIWNPADNQFGAGILIVGTVITTAVAMVMAVPIGIGIAIFLAELTPKWIAAPLSWAIDFLAAVPSIVIGIWALLTLSPVFASGVEPFLSKMPVIGFFARGEAYGPSVLLAAVVLAIMTLPTIVALSRTACQGVARTDLEAALALGATRWQVIWKAVLPGARSGIAAAITLAVGRALGESIAVALVIGNRPAIPHSLLAPAATLGTAIINQFAEATPGLDLSSIIALAAILLMLTVLVNIGGQLLLRSGGLNAFGRRELPTGMDDEEANAQAAGDAQRERQQTEERRTRIQTRARRSLPGRRGVGWLMQVVCCATMLVGLAPLFAVLIFTCTQGVSGLSWAFLTHQPTPPGIPGGGIESAIMGTASIIALALVIAIPIGMLTALFLYERSGKLSGCVRFCADVMTGVPSIIIGIFAYVVLIETTHQFSTIAASFAIAVLMIPIMIRANEEAMRTVALELWEAGIALGARRSRVARSIVVRGALPQIVSGNLLALARGVGETAPLLFTVAAPTLAMTLTIYSNATQGLPSATQIAWSTAFVLLTFVLAISLLARIVAWGFSRNSH